MEKNILKEGVSILFILGMLIGGTTMAQEKKAGMSLYISTTGNDSWSGKLAEPNKEKTDGPFASIEMARDAIRELRGKEKGLKVPVNVTLRGGTYCLDKTLIFTSLDSGTKECPITYQAYKDEKPIISGGRIIKGWRPFASTQGNLWSVKIPEVESGDWNFNQLFVNGERRIRARAPNKGDFFRTVRPLFKPSDTRGFFYKKGDIKDWENIEDVIFIAYHSWETSIHYISSLDTENCTVKFKSPAPWAFGNWEKKQRYYVENVFEALDSPGEWYLNRNTGILYYYPMPGENMEKAEVIAPVVKVTILSFQGNPKNGEYIEYLNIKNISFQHTNANLPKTIRNCSQGEIFQEAVIMARGLRNSNFENCEIAHTGGHGIWFASGCEDNRVFHCHIYDMNGGGVYIGGGWGVEESIPALRNTVDNNFIHDGGHLFHGAHGVWVGKSSYNKITHNEISDFDYTGISVGWSWGFQPSSANNNIIDYNHIHHLSNGEGLSDMGGIYTLGISPGTTERYNLIHDVYNYAPVSHGSGIYPDEGSSEILIENNIVYRVRTCPLFQHYGKDNIVRNNILALGEAGQLQRCREDKPCHYIAEGNIVYAEIEQMLGGVWKNGDWIIGRNVYWCTTGEPKFMGMDFDTWKVKGNDVDSIVADPLFVDAKNYDFRLKPNSPAIKLGFKPIDISKTGLYGEPEWVNLPKKYPNRKRNEVPLPPPEPIADDFEMTPVGSPPSDAKVNGVEKGASVKVTDEAASSGKQSLKFTDAPGLKNIWDPHIYYNPNFKSGKMRFSIDIMNSNDMPANFYVEMRDWRQNPYAVGPTFAITPEGKFSASGQEIATVPLGEWFRVEINFEAGEDASKSYELKLTLPKQKPQTFELTSNQNFNMLTWFGISSMSNDKTAFYVDNLELGPDDGKKKERPPLGKAAVKEVKVVETAKAVETTKTVKTVKEETVKSEGLAGYWKFDEGKEEIAKDVSGNKNNGDVTAKWAKGSFGHCLYFDGASAANVALADNSTLQFDKSDFTVECWICPETLEIDSQDKRRRFIFRYGYPEAYWVMDIRTSGQVLLEARDDNKVGNNTLSDGKLPEKQWTHLAIVVDRKNFKVRYYFNGKLDSTKDIKPEFKGDIDIEGTQFTIGTTWQPFIGLMDEVKFYKRALNEEEIKASYEKEKDKRTSVKYEVVE